MSEKRRDNKGRILRTGESQRKDRRYAYKYTDAYGKPQFVCSWKLVVTDKTPAGKRDTPALREKIKEICKDLDDGIDIIGKKMTVCQLYAKQNGLRKNVKHGTKKGRDYLMSLLRDDPIGMKSIETVKQSNAKEWAIRMSEKGFAYQSISNFKRSLKAAFYTAIEDDCIRKNPFNFALDTVIEDDRELKAALTPEQVDSLLAFMEQDAVYKKYRDEVIILLGTGLRISEFCGLTTALDFKNRSINVDHQLLRDAEIGYWLPGTTNSFYSANNAVIMLDEAEVSFHPEWQRKYFNAFLKFIKKNICEHGTHVQLILATHSPIILSDIPKQNTVFLKKDKLTQNTIYVEGEETFAANIFSLYHKTHWK